LILLVADQLDFQLAGVKEAMALTTAERADFGRMTRYSETKPRMPKKRMSNGG
jgi:hypothetical protein